MSKVCPKCGKELKPNNSFCPKCGTPINSSSEDYFTKHKKTIIAIIIIIICIIIISTAVYIGFSGNNNPINSLINGKQEKILTTDDLKINMTGYNYKLESNTTTSSGVNGRIETYSVDGNGDHFTLVIMITNDTTGTGSAGETNTSLTGETNSVASNRYIAGKFYWVQIVGGNQEHCSQAYLDSIILSKSDTNVTASSTDSTSSTTSSSSSSSSSAKMTEAECIASGKHDTNKDGYCTNCGHYSTSSGDAVSYTSRSQCIAQGTHDTDGDGYCKVCHSYG